MTNIQRAIEINPSLVDESIKVFENYLLKKGRHLKDFMYVSKERANEVLYPHDQGVMDPLILSIDSEDVEYIVDQYSGLVLGDKWVSYFKQEFDSMRSSNTDIVIKVEVIKEGGVLDILNKLAEVVEIAEKLNYTYEMHEYRDKHLVVLPFKEELTKAFDAKSINYLT